MTLLAILLVFCLFYVLRAFYDRWISKQISIETVGGNCLHIMIP